MGLDLEHQRTEWAPHKPLPLFEKIISTLYDSVSVHEQSYGYIQTHFLFETARDVADGTFVSADSTRD
jgi:hypothetical protein